MKPIIKWPGGKERELPVIRNAMPAFTGRYIDPFVGGGAVYFDVESDASCINDLSRDLIGLYRSVQQGDPDFYAALGIIAGEFHALGGLCAEYGPLLLKFYDGRISAEELAAKIIAAVRTGEETVFRSELVRNLIGKRERTRKLEKSRGPLSQADLSANLEAAVKSAYYMTLRSIYNQTDGISPGRRAAVFCFIREYCYSSMFRYNSKGAFNVPYGGLSYNGKDFRRKAEALEAKDLRDLLLRTQICCEDFEEFLREIDPTSEDFLFLDPPYDSEFSTYAQNRFGREEQLRLHRFLRETPARFLMVIGRTDFISGLYGQDFRVRAFDKTYAVSFKNRNRRSARHLLITNY